MAEFRIRVNTNAPAVAAAVRRVFRDQVPFAASLAINNTTKEVQKSQRIGMERRFTIRRRWVTQGVRISQFSTKRRLEAHIEIEEKRFFLPRHEPGGVARPQGTRFAKPTDEIKRGKTGVISNVLRPRKLDFVKQGPSGNIFRGKRRTYMIRRPGGRGVIRQRSGRRGSTVSKVIFTLIPKARLDPELKFEDTARRVVSGRYERNFVKAFDRAIGTAR